MKASLVAPSEISASGLRFVVAVEDRWSAWRRIGALLLLIVTLVDNVPNVLLITEPMS